MFALCSLRNRFVYRNLSNQSLSIDEKTFLGSEAAGQSSLLTWPDESFTVSLRISKSYSLPEATVRGWNDKVANSIPFTNETGRPLALDEVATEKLNGILESRRAARNAVPLAETLSLIGTCVTETHMRMGKRDASAVSTCCVTMQTRILRDLNIVKRKPQILTEARLKALRCPRLSYIWGCVCMAYFAGLFAENKWNADATTIVVNASRQPRTSDILISTK